MKNILIVDMDEFNEKWSPYKKALYFEKKGNWDKAHELVQDLPDQKASWIHAYLHRVEGDEFNAGYWYRKAGKPIPSSTLREEWEYLWGHID